MSMRDFYKEALPSGRTGAIAPRAYVPQAAPTLPPPPHMAQGSRIQHDGVPPSGILELNAQGAQAAWSGAPQGYRALKSLPKDVRPARGPRVRFFDPLSLVYATGFRDRRFSLTYDTLRRTAYQLSLVGSIIQTRVKQVAAFAQPFRENQQVGFAIRFKDENHIPTESERRSIVEMERMIMQCGFGENPYSPYPRDDFNTFLEKISRDSLMFDQCCHPMGTLVETAYGLKPIEDIDVGEMLRTHTGELRPVAELIRRNYTGGMVRLRARGQTIEMTEGHPLLVCSDKWAYLGKKPIPKPDWMGAGEIEEGMYLCYPVPKLPKEDVHTLMGDLDRDLARFFGLYAADGHTNGASIVFTFGSHEEDLVGAVELVAERMGWGVVVTDDQYGRAATSVRCNPGSVEWADWLNTVFGRGAHEKRVPGFMMRATDECKRAFLAGYLEGDGYLKATGASFNTVSTDLFGGLRILFASQGVYCAAVHTPEGGAPGSGWSDQIRSNISGSAYRELARDTGLPVREPSKLREPYLFDGEYFYLRVNCKETWSVEEFPVFNFEVERDHSYIAQGFVSHNCFEVIPDHRNRPWEFRAVDAATIRLAATYDGYDGKGPRKFRSQDFAERWQHEYGEDFEIEGQGVYSVQVIHGRIEGIFTFHDMAFGIRNPRTDMWVNGYGFSEIEMCLNTVLRMLWAEEYNARNFRQGSMANGILNFKGDAYSHEQLEAFRRVWRSSVQGVENAHRVPIVQVPEGVEFVNVQKGNHEMEYQQWLEYLLKIVSGVYQIDPAEINFDIGKANSQGMPMFESKQEWRIKYSKDKGLTPLLKFLARLISRHVVETLDDRLYLDFVGLDQLSEPDRVQLLQSRVATYITINEARKEEGLPPLVGGDTILNPQFEQAKQAALQAPEDNTPGRVNPFAPWLTSGEDDLEVYGEVPPTPLYLQEGGDEFSAAEEAPAEGDPGGGFPM